MFTNTRSALIKAHLILATFIFPAVLMFLITGGLYTWGYKGSYESDKYTLELAQPLPQEESALKALVQSELRRLSLDDPAGGAKIKKAGASFAFEWTGSRRDVLLEPTADPLSATLTVKETTWYRNLVQLHKAKGGEIFKIYAAFLAIGLFVILLTGFLMAVQMPRYRKMTTISSLLGVAVFGLAVMVS